MKNQDHFIRFWRMLVIAAACSLLFYVGLGILIYCLIYRLI